MFIAMYTISYVGGGNLMRFSEGATFLAIVSVSYLKLFMDTTICFTAWDWPVCHRATEQLLTTILRYDGTVINPSLLLHLSLAGSVFYYLTMAYTTILLFKGRVRHPAGKG